jgi:hypothetical protein
MSWRNPFENVAMDPKRFQVSFLSAEPLLELADE